MAIVMLIPSFAFADDGPFIKDLSKLRAKPYEWQFYDENGKAIDKRVILAEVKMKAISARHIETHGGKISYQMWQNDCGTGIGSNGVENQLGSLKIIKESN